MRNVLSILGITLLLSACADPTGPAQRKEMALANTDVTYYLSSGDHVTATANKLWIDGVNAGWAGSDYSGAMIKIRWNGNVPGGSGESFQMNVAWTPGCTFGVPIGPGLCVADHKEVTFYNSQSFHAHVMYVRNYLLKHWL